MSGPYMVDPMSIPPGIPLQMPPPGFTSNFEHPDMARHNKVVATVAALLTIALVVVVTRLVTRAFIVRQFGWDDGLCIVATAFTVTFNAVVIKQLEYGLATYNWDLDTRSFLMNQLSGWIEWNAIGALCYIITFGFIKLSILLLYLRVFGVAHNGTRIAIWCVFGLVSAVIVSNVFGNLFLCVPVKKLFVFNSPGECKFDAILKLGRFQSYMQIFTDIMVTAIPIPMVFKLRMPAPQKIGIMAIMATGFVVTIISIIRLTLLYPKVQSTLPIDVAQQYPTTYWSVIEVNLALVCASAPALKQFIGHTIPVVRSYGSNITPRLSNITNSLPSGSNSSSNNKTARWGSLSALKSGRGTTTSQNGIKQHHDFSISSDDRRVQDGSYLELGPRTNPVPDKSQEYGFGPSTHVTVGDKEMSSTSSRDPII
ncbi:MAG: hypothetical protein M4579_001499 [Chaenotheca gracillima]|nr:MAG: hypothetical protein M4579_001499 [Chaenotheca gracillima]